MKIVREGCRAVVLAGCVGIGVFCAQHASRESGRGDVIRATRIELLRLDGSVAMTLDSEADGGRLSMQNSDGASVLEIGVSSRGDGLVVLLGESGVLARLMADPDGGALRTYSRRSGALLAEVAPVRGARATPGGALERKGPPGDSHLSGGLTLFDRSGQPIVEAGGKWEGGGRVVTSNGAGKQWVLGGDG